MEIATESPAEHLTSLKEELTKVSFRPQPIQFVVSSKVLLRHIKPLKSAITTNPILPILENILFSVTPAGVLTLTASDLHSMLICTLPVEVVDKTTEQTGFCIDATRLYKLLNSLPEQPVEIAFDGAMRVTIQTDAGARYNFCAERALDYPKLPTIAEATTFRAAGKELANALINTLPFTCDDDLRPAMTGVYFDVNKFVATDGHRLVRFEAPNITANAQFILPYRSGSIFLKAYDKSDSEVTIEAMPRTEPVDFKTRPSINIRFTWANFVLIARLIDEKFPDYQNAIPANNPIEAVINRQALIRLLGRVDLFANPVTHQIRLTFGNSKIAVSADNYDINEDCTESIAATINDEEITIGFNVRLMIDMLKKMPESHVSINLSYPNLAAILYPHDGKPNTSHTCLLMPVMLTTYA